MDRRFRFAGAAAVLVSAFRFATVFGDFAYSPATWRQTSCHARGDMMSCCVTVHGNVLRINDHKSRLGRFGWSLPILQFYVCVGQSGRIQLIDVAHIGGLV